MTTLYQYFEKYSQQYSKRILFVKENLDYKTSLNLVKRRALFLQQNGVVKGDNVAILCENRAEWSISYFAITALGARAVLLDINLDQAHYDEMLVAISSKAILKSKQFTQFNFPEIKQLIIEFPESLADNDSEFSPPEIDEQDIASLSFTSGTTGKSKIVPLTHRNVVRTAISTYDTFGIEDKEDRSFYSILPLYHVYGMAVGVTVPIYCGARIVYQTSLRGPDILADLKEYKINIFAGVPRLWENFLDGALKRVKAQSEFKYRLFLFVLNHQPTLRHLGFGPLLKKMFQPIQDAFGGHIEFFVNGGAKLSKRYALYYKRIGFTIVNGYGLTETVGPISITPVKRVKVLSVGHPIEGMEFEIREKNKDDIGEIWMRGDSVFPGYLDNEEATREVFDDQGWFNSGDMGFIDKDGDLHIRGRKKNVIVLASGKNVYPEDIENHYHKSPLVNDIVVFGKKIDNKTVIYAVIVPEQKNKDSYNEIKKELKRLGHGLPSYKRIANFAISYDDLPRTTTQKVQAFKVDENLEKGLYQVSANDANFAVTELVGKSLEEENIVSLLKKVMKVDILYENQKITDFDIDSLRYIDIISFLEEELSIKIDSDKFMDIRNMGSLLKYLSSLKPHNLISIPEFITKGFLTTNFPVVQNPWLELNLFIFAIVSKVFWRLKVINKEKLTDLGNSLIIANNQSYLDILWIYICIPRRYRRRLYVSTKKRFKHLKYMLPGINFIFFDIDNDNFVPVLKAEADILRQGGSLIVFPEGTRTATGKLNEFRIGPAFLAQALGKDVLPLTINGSFDIYPRHKKLPRFFGGRRGEIFVHDKLSAKDFPSAEELNLKLRNIVQSELKEVD